MTILDTVGRLASRLREQRARRRMQVLISALPAELQRDIGWPAADLFTADRTHRLR